MPSDTNTRILIVADHVLFRESLERALSSMGPFEVHGCGAYNEVLEAVTSRRFDIVLVDFDLGSDQTFSLLHVLPKRCNGTCRLAVLTDGVSLRTAHELLSCDCVCGLLLKDIPLCQLSESILSLMENRTVVDSRYISALTLDESHCELVDRERNVLQFLVEGQSNKEIASRLFTSESTVKNVLQGLFRRYNVRTRSQLVRIALDQNVFREAIRKER